MSRITLICFFAALLAACGTESPAQTALAQERLACANIGIDPASPAFGQCVGDLDLSCWNDPADGEDGVPAKARLTLLPALLLRSRTPVSRRVEWIGKGRFVI